VIPDHEKVTARLRTIVSNTKNRIASLQEISHLLNSAGGCRWVGLYDVDDAAGLVKNIVWSGPERARVSCFPHYKRFDQRGNLRPQIN